MTFDLLGTDCAEKITHALRDVSRAHHQFGLRIVFDKENQKYVIQTECSQARAQRDFQMRPDGNAELMMTRTDGTRTLMIFPTVRTPHGVLILERPIDDMPKGEVFEDPENVSLVCKLVDQSMARNHKMSSYSEECRLAEVEESDFTRALIRGEFELSNEDFRKVTWAKQEYGEGALQN